MRQSLKNYRSLVYGLIGVLWLLAVFIGYAYMHKPFTLNELLPISKAIWQIVVVGVIVSLAGGLGYRLLRGRTGQLLQRTVIQSALGLAILSVATLVIGASLGLLWWLFASSLLAAGILLRKDILSWWQAWAEINTYWRNAGHFGKAVLLAAFILLGCTFFIALAPPLAFDALTYHLAIPQAYLLTGRVTYLPYTMFWGMPEQSGMLYTLVMMFSGLESAPLLSWAMGFLTLIALFNYAKDKLGAKAGYAAIAAVLAGEALTALLASGYVEWPTMLYGMATLIALDDWMTSKAHKSIALAGLFAGLTLATKYTAGIILLGGLVVILLKTRENSVRKTLSALIRFSLCAFLAMTPWLVKNAFATGNPFYPLLYPSGAMDEFRLHFYQDNPIYKDWREMLILPWQATVWGIDGKPGYSASIGPLLLGLSLLAWMGWRTRSKSEQDTIKVAAAVTVTGLIAWAIASRLSGLLIQTRLYFAMFPAWAVLSAAGYDALCRQQAQGIRFGRLAGSLLLLALGFTTFQTATGWLIKNPILVLPGYQTDTEYLANNLGDYFAAMQAVNALPSDARTLMLWETRELYCLPRCDGDEVIDRWFYDSRLYGDIETVLEMWQLTGYTHLLYNRLGADFIRQEDPHFLTEEDWEKLENLFSALPPPIEIGGSYQLYTLPKDNP